jgi:hypothetical protein
MGGGRVSVGLVDDPVCDVGAGAVAARALLVLEQGEG